ncbi:hypothetical protein DWV34_07465 [Anaerostipes sp. AF04-45]|nr:hypothetical protein DWV34_07465 [Anaerostipes sp. AF04-45]
MQSGNLNVRVIYYNNSRLFAIIFFKFQDIFADYLPAERRNHSGMISLSCRHYIHFYMIVERHSKSRTGII